MDKIRTNGIPLKDFVGSTPNIGILTGFNDAFLITTATKQSLVSLDPNCEKLIQPYIRGQDVDRWEGEPSGLYMIAMKSSGNYAWSWKGKPELEAEEIFRKEFPSLFAHMQQYRSQLIKRNDQGEYWWELRSCAYWDKFLLPKIMYQEIQFHPSYLIDHRMTLANNKVFFFPSRDYFLLGLLNSPLMWWYNWRYLPHMKDEALTPVAFKMENLTIPTPSLDIRSETETLVARLIELKGQRTQGTRDVLNWLRVEFGIEKASQKLQALSVLGSNELADEVKKLRGRKATMSVAEVKRLAEEHKQSVLPLHENFRESDRLEHRVSDLVNAAFGLTPEEVELMWKTAPPRMPIAGPSPAKL